MDNRTKANRLLEGCNELFKSYPKGSPSQHAARRFYRDVEGLSEAEAGRMYDILKEHATRP